PSTPTPAPSTPTTEGLSIEASLADMKAVYEQTAMLQAEEELRADYEHTSSWNLYKRAKFFLLRGRMRKAKIAELMKGYQKLPFTQDQQVNQTLEAASTRHQLQYQLDQNAGIHAVEIVNIPQVNTFAGEFIKGNIDESQFQTAFNMLVEHNPHLQQILALGKVDYVGTNLLQQLKFEKAQYALLEELAEALQKGENTDQIQQKIEHFLEDYQQSPFFLQEIGQDLEAGDLEKLKKYFAHQKAKRALELKNLKIKLSLLT
ncbi:MAG: hypothetical protein Q4B28_08520, partial [bacterium]|nr:hypothetical protein [bacterium]